MRPSNRYRVKTDRIHSLEDLRKEKMKLRFEILKTEQDIHTGYRDLVDALSPRNLLNTVVTDVSASSTVLSKAFTFGKTLLERRKKKKKHPKTGEGPVAPAE